MANNAFEWQKVNSTAQMYSANLRGPVQVFLSLWFAEEWAIIVEYYGDRIETKKIADYIPGQSLQEVFALAKEKALDLLLNLEIDFGKARQELQANA